MSASPAVRDEVVTPAPDVVARLNRRMGDAVRHMLDAFVADIPFYRRLPEEQLHTDIAQVARDNMTDFMRCCRERRLPSTGELLAARAGAVRRAEEGVPLDDLLMAYTTGNRITWQLLAQEVPPGREAEIAAFTPFVYRYLEAMVRAVTEAYVEERRRIEQDEGSAFHALVQQLLEGEHASALAQRLGIVLADTYLVVALHLAEHPDERDGDVNTDVAARRKVRRVHSAVGALPGRAATLAQLSPVGGTLLLPGIGHRLPGRAETKRTVLALGEAAGVEATAASVVARSRADLPESARRAHELLRLARALDRPADVYGLDDLVLEYQVSLDSPARHRLAELVRPLVSHADLLPTVQCWLRNERNRREAADELHVHPNTLDKRLERVAMLTGIEVGTTRGVALLQAGLVALQVEGAADGTSPRE